MTVPEFLKGLEKAQMILYEYELLYTVKPNFGEQHY